MQNHFRPDHRSTRHGIFSSILAHLAINYCTKCWIFSLLLTLQHICIVHYNVLVLLLRNRVSIDCSILILETFCLKETKILMQAAAQLAGGSRSLCGRRASIYVRKTQKIQWQFFSVCGRRALNGCWWQPRRVLMIKYNNVLLSTVEIKLLNII